MPRTRGGLPELHQLSREVPQFAPHTRGSTRSRQKVLPAWSVCPAHAGVYRPGRCQGSGRHCLPRTRGGLPQALSHRLIKSRFAPHTRGSTPFYVRCHRASMVCPAHAGVYPHLLFIIRPGEGLPRTRGGLPFSVISGDIAPPFAPHTRGSTVIGLAGDDHIVVCPAHAGVYRSRESRARFGLCLPRTRGGLPLAAAGSTSHEMFAPHTRGSTDMLGYFRAMVTVCPADAGVYRMVVRRPLRWSCLPRRRGGLPLHRSSRTGGIAFAPQTRGLPNVWALSILLSQFAPQTRGSTQEPLDFGPNLSVCPADAGVYPPTTT